MKKLDINKESITINQKVGIKDISNIDFNHKKVFFSDEVKDIHNIIQIVEYISNYYEGVMFWISLYDDEDIFDKRIELKDIEQYKNMLKKASSKFKKLDDIMVATLGSRSFLGMFAYYSLEHIMCVDEFIHRIILDLDHMRLSDFEKIMTIYMVVTKMFQYQEAKTNILENSNFVTHSSLTASGNIYGVFESGYIVCEGYAEFISKLLDEANIKNNIVTSEEHARNIVQIDDEKYHIHGTYLCDSTLESDRYFEIINAYLKYNDLKDGNSNILFLFTSLKYFVLNLEEALNLLYNYNNKIVNDYIDTLGYVKKAIYHSNGNIESIIAKEKIGNDKILLCLYNISRKIFQKEFTDRDFYFANSFCRYDRSKRRTREIR